MNEDLQGQIDALEVELASAQGTKCEVHSRIVGYYRAVQNWNPGKATEYKTRKVYKP
jgi:anaerobic ribonucleoside-triphosphate reductase